MIKCLRKNACLSNCFMHVRPWDAQSQVLPSFEFLCKHAACEKIRSTFWYHHNISQIHFNAVFKKYFLFQPFTLNLRWIWYSNVSFLVRKLLTKIFYESSSYNYTKVINNCRCRFWETEWQFEHLMPWCSGSALHDITQLLIMTTRHL